jgi:antitoxin component YwqK of YwqJK toxin-antitoxin module
MKFYLFLIFTLFGLSPLFSQELIVDSGVVLRKGVYRTFEEFRANKPSLAFPSGIDTVSLKYGSIGNRERITYFDIGRNIGDLKANQMFGFCDGESVYFNVDYSKFSKFNFVKVEHLGRYCYFKHSTPFKPSMVAAGVAGGLVGGLIVGAAGQPAGECVLDVNNGVSYSLSKTKLKSLFSDDEGLKKDIKYLVGINPELKDLAIKYSKIYSYEIEREMFGKNADLDQLIYRKSSDTSIENYAYRMSRYQSDPMFFEIKVIKNYYGNDQLKVFGIWAKHEKGNSDDYPYDIGTWYHFHKNGQLKEEVNYNLLGKKEGRNITYTDKGVIIKELVYSDGELVE